MWGFKDAVRATVADEATTATALNDRANELEREGNHQQAAVYHNATTRAEARASLFRRLLED